MNHPAASCKVSKSNSLSGTAASSGELNPLRLKNGKNDKTVSTRPTYGENRQSSWRVNRGFNKIVIIYGRTKFRRYANIACT